MGIVFPILIFELESSSMLNTIVSAVKTVSNELQDDA